MSNIGDLTSKVAIVTGSSSGFGRAIALAYARAGALVVCADKTPDPPPTPLLQNSVKDEDLTTPTHDLINAEFASSSKDNGVPKAIYSKTDVTQEETIKATVAAAVEKYGRLDILVNNAGLSNPFPFLHSSSSSHSPLLRFLPSPTLNYQKTKLTKHVRFPPSGVVSNTQSKHYQETGSFARCHEDTLDNLDRDWSVNVRGVWLFCHHALKQMLSQAPPADSTSTSSGSGGGADRGWIVNIASVASLVGLPGYTTYASTKGAVLQMTRCLGLEYAPDRVHVNCICPGFAETGILEPMKAVSGEKALGDLLVSRTPWGRTGRAREIADMAVFLAGPGASWSTGQPFVVDGGYTAQ
ncbi:hypothetical protein N3K66_005353 [Trichothecium roseum]|uniref:Uncharacterized protein n=1 Tax=Trichothecium roseum TaxID=47278 RepID=A0ACC0UZI4_9HYPO|nr:hypothetical protein N3K66_005353 [Trichothecium roseum]